MSQDNTSADPRLQQLFGDVPLESEISVRLPSEGRFYLEKRPEVVITPIKFEDEKQLIGSYRNNVNPVNLILSKCVKDLDVSRMLIMDKMYLLLRIREISYGAEYPALVTCPKCGTKSDIKINLSNLLINKLPEDLTDPREFNLPKLKKNIKVKFPRVVDEIYLNTQENVYANLWRFIVELNGVTDPVFIAQAIPKMPIMDIKKIVKEVMREDIGLNPKFMLECGACNAQSVLEVPINENFFSVI